MIEPNKGVLETLKLFEPAEVNLLNVVIHGCFAETIYRPVEWALFLDAMITGNFHRRLDADKIRVFPVGSMMKEINFLSPIYADLNGVPILGNDEFFHADYVINTAPGASINKTAGLKGPP